MGEPPGAAVTGSVPDDDALLAAYAFDMPEELIAKEPLPQRSASRLLVLRANGTAPEHRHITDLVALLQPGDCLVLNDSTVIPARLRAQKEGSGGSVEVLLIRPLDTAHTWACLLGTSKRVKEGQRLVFPAVNDAADKTVPALLAVVERPLHDEPGAFAVRFTGDALAHARNAGEIPLPPYMQRSAGALDQARYQTVYANRAHEGSVAAPTAGLHFDDALLAAVRARGVGLAFVTLHVGPGTFLPIRAALLADHQMHPEVWELPAAAAEQLNATRAAGGRIVAVGTTATRVLESAAARLSPGAAFHADAGLTRLFITPGYRFLAIDALLTNFHLPASSLLVLVSAVCGRKRVLAAYAEAVAAGYRFYSYGDATYLEVVRDQAGAPPPRQVPP